MNIRLAEFRAMLDKREIESAIITNPKNIGYLSRFFYESGYLFITPKRAFLITDFRYKEEAEKHASSEFEVVTPKDKHTFLSMIISEDHIGNIGFESASLSVAEFHSLQADIYTPFVPMSDILLEMRAKKSQEEIASLKKAQSIADYAYSHILKMITPDMTETDIALELSYYMQKNGASGNSFDIIAASGASSALPHAKCRKEKISKGFLTMDFGCVYDGYCSDMTRTVVVGKADPEMKRLYQTVLDAQNAAISSIKEGVICSEIDAVARNIIDGNGYKDAFGHSLGHGVGLDIHEEPRLSPFATNTRLLRGNIVTVEPGIYLAGKYGCRIEDMGCVTETGFDDFTASSKELIELFV